MNPNYVLDRGDISRTRPESPWDPTSLLYSG